ncbi:hypothetical protein BGW41_006535 [Actinomortierella wolfii]|nr:hypothetical protein BGW41_006534 [Actinomortierella wolfii]KAG0221777.1 hypothetical protein BGW41_006535 [Actinomortierella wolfii]
MSGLLQTLSMIPIGVPGADNINEIVDDFRRQLRTMFEQAIKDTDDLDLAFFSSFDPNLVGYEFLSPADRQQVRNRLRREFTKELNKTAQPLRDISSGHDEDNVSKGNQIKDMWMARLQKRMEYQQIEEGVPQEDELDRYLQQRLKHSVNRLEASPYSLCTTR